MQEVGIYLRKEALNNGLHRDAFARSAYTRYYYASFLYLRSVLTIINPAWGILPHKSYPEVLGGQILKKFKDEKLKALKRSDADLVRIIDTAIQSTKELKSIMEEAYAIRVTADYQPDIKVNFIGFSKFSLNSVEDNRAHQWFGRVENFSSNILKAWRQINA